MSHESLEFSQYTHVTSLYITWYTMSKRCITILYHAIENTVTNTITCDIHAGMIGRLDVTPSNNIIQRLSCMAWYKCWYYVMHLLDEIGHDSKDFQASES